MKITALPDHQVQSTIPDIKIRPNHLTKSESHEAPVTPVREEAKPVEVDSYTAKYAELAKRQKENWNKIQAKEAALLAREEAMKAKESEYATQYVQKSKVPEMFQKNSQEAMRELGLSGDQLTQYLLNQPNPQELMIQELKAEVAALKGMPDQTKSMFEERDKLARKQAVAQIALDVKALIARDSNYATIQGTGSEDEVVQLIEKEFDEKGVLLSNEEASERVENHMVDELVKIYQNPKIHAKIQAKLAPASVTAEETPKSSETKPLIKTLAHSQVTTSSKPMSPRERAIAMLEGKPI